MSFSPMISIIGYISRGKLYLRNAQGQVRSLDSEFGQTVQDRMQRMQQRNAWKNKSIMDNFLPPGLAQQMEEQAAAVPVLFTSLCAGMDGQVLYALEAGSMAGIFSLTQRDHWPNLDNLQEQRLFHSTEVRVQHLNFHPEQKLIACVLAHPDGSANIATMPIDGIRPREVTEGDSLDLAPHWIPGSSKALVFQSAGLARDRSGYVREQGAFTIEKLDFDRQTVISLAADPRFDFLGPQMDCQGNLYYIRRPYKPVNDRLHWLHLLRDILLMPFRLIYAIFQWLNFFTRMYTGKPLTIAGQPRNSELNRMLVWGNWIDVDKVLQQNRTSKEGAPPLVPKTWQLVRQSADGVTEILASEVLSYDLAPDGVIVYTNGSAIYSLLPNKPPERLTVGRLIEQVVLIPG